jgi:hypothetical protein
MAVGYDSATLTIDEHSPGTPGIASEPAHFTTVQEVSATDGGWRAKIRAGVIPGIVVVRVQIPGRPPAIIRLLTNLDPTDFAPTARPISYTCTTSTTSVGSAAGSPFLPRHSISRPRSTARPRLSIAPR